MRWTWTTTSPWSMNSWLVASVTKPQKLGGLSHSLQPEIRVLAGLVPHGSSKEESTSDFLPNSGGC